MVTPDAGLKSTPSTSKPSEEDAQPHDDDVNTQIFAEDISMVLRCIRCADSENGLIFAELALVFEINAFFMKILLT